MEQVWGIAETKLKDKFERKMMMFRSLVKSIILHCDENVQVQFSTCSIALKKSKKIHEYSWILLECESAIV